MAEQTQKGLDRIFDIDKSSSKYSSSVILDDDINFKLYEDSDSNYILEPLDGSLEIGSLSTIIDENGKKYFLISKEKLTALINSFKKSREENFNLILEKELTQSMPIDYEDALAVTKRELKKMYMEDEIKNLESVDIKKIIRSVKKRYPNLFINFGDMFK